MNNTAHYHNVKALTKDELQQRYDNLAAGYSQGMWVENYIFGVRRLRASLMIKATGKVLDVACGTGENFPYFKAATDVTAIDLSPQMLETARTRAEKLRLKVDCRLVDAEALEFPDRSFDTVVSALSTCTFPDPVAALREMGRVCRVDGRILLLEHGRSRLNWLAHHQDRNAHQHFQKAGCRWNQQPLELVQAAGLRIVSTQRMFFGIFYAIEAVPK